MHIRIIETWPLQENERFWMCLMDPDIPGSWVTLTKGKPIPDHEHISFWGFTCAVLYQEYSFVVKWVFLFLFSFLFVCYLREKNLEKKWITHRLHSYIQKGHAIWSHTHENPEEVTHRGGEGSHGCRDWAEGMSSIWRVARESLGGRYCRRTRLWNTLCLMTPGCTI